MKPEQHKDLVRHECSHCEKVVYTIDVGPPDDPYAICVATGLWVEGYDDVTFVLCTECADILYQKSKLAYGGDGSAILI